ncbi:MAG TPA: hypothetical protein VIL97_04415 [Thermoanaerobaculia bacterium]
MAIPPVTPEQAQYVLQKLVEQKKIGHNDIVSALANMRREIAELEQKLNTLRQMTGRAAAPRRGDGTARGRTRQRASRKPTPKQIASRKVQGQYLALLTRVPKKDRPRFQKIAQEQDRESAIKAMRAAAEK